jgi:hypothetical protein
MSAKFANAAKPAKPFTLRAFIETLVAPGPQPASDGPPWFEPGQVCQIYETTYWQFLELLPPRWMDGDRFAFGEGSGPFRLFWQAKDGYFARELTDDETRRFCELSGVSLQL